MKLLQIVKEHQTVLDDKKRRAQAIQDAQNAEYEAIFEAIFSKELDALREANISWKGDGDYTFSGFRIRLTHPSRVGYFPVYVNSTTCFAWGDKEPKKYDTKECIYEVAKYFGIA